jgi:5-deoxy-glucuronate isomerase
MEPDAMVYNSRSLPPAEDGDLLRFSRGEAGWEWMSFAVRRLNAGRTLTVSANKEEVALVLLGGVCVADWGKGEQRIGSRANAFDGLPYALYLPHESHATLRAETACEIAECSVPSEARLEPALITPADVSTGLRGGENASRQIVTVIPPEFAADKLVVFEVYTPGGNWSSYPPHKHDVHNPPMEVDLDEIYYYRIKEPSGYALQNLYNKQTQRDIVVKARDGDAVLVRDGYHPVVAGPGYDTYYLNFLAGTARTMSVTEDASHVWLKDTWKQMDPRLPLVRA